MIRFLVNLLSVAAVILRPADACFITGTSCSDIPTSNSGTNTIAPTIIYSHSFGSAHETGSTATIYCAVSSTSSAFRLLHQQGSQTVYNGPQTLTCTNGVWSTSATWTCSFACADLDVDAVVYANGHSTVAAHSIPGATGTVTCSGHSGTADIFEGTSTTAVSSPQTYTCQSDGTWARSGGASTTAVHCKRRCTEPPAVGGPGDADIEDDYDGILPSVTVASGTSITTMFLNTGVTGGDGDTPCETGSGNPDMVIHFTDGTTTGNINDVTVTNTLTCDDGLWTMASFTVNSNTFNDKTLAKYQCL